MTNSGINKDISIDSTDTKKVTREYCEQVYILKFNNLDDTETFLERRKLPKQTHKEMANVTSSEYVTLNS